MSRVSDWAGDPPSRINLGIKKASGAGQPLKWHLLNQYIQPSSIAYTSILPPRESDVPIPFGVWFIMDVKIQTGEGDKGRTTITITEQGKFTSNCYQVDFNFSFCRIPFHHPHRQVPLMDCR